jgi:exonuclease VII small subunit
MGRIFKNTAAPWSRESTYVYSPAGNVCACGEPRASRIVGYTPVQFDSIDLTEAADNAALIVAAVNSFETTLAALKSALAWFENQGVKWESYAGYWKEARALSDQLRAAIQKAEGP